MSKPYHVYAPNIKDNYLEFDGPDDNSLVHAALIKAHPDIKDYQTHSEVLSDVHKAALLLAVWGIGAKE